MQAVQPRSVVDVGCGTGTWLAEWLALGVTDVLGVDGDYVPRDRLEIPEALFAPRDLRQPLRLDRRFDLAQSLEVAEHLPPPRAESFVADLVAVAPAVLFSASIPGQRGTDHINEQWQDYWQGLFAGHGYTAVDLVRSVVWADPAVECWYSQNTILYVASGVPTPEHDALPLRLVHPKVHEKKLDRIRALERDLTQVRAPEELADQAPGGSVGPETRVPTLGELANQFLPSVRNSVRHRLGKLKSRG